MRKVEFVKKNSKTGPGMVRTGDHGEHLWTGSALTTGTLGIWCWKSWKQSHLNDDASWMCLKHSQRSGPHLFLNGRIMEARNATQAHAGVKAFNGARALAPVVFSDCSNLKTQKIRKIKSSKVPYHPKSDLLNPMVISVCAKYACTSRLDRNSLKRPNNGNMISRRSSLHERHHSWPIRYLESI